MNYVLVAIAGGVGAILLVAAGLAALETIRSWARNRRRLAEIRYRPKPPFSVDSIELSKYDGYWGATCLNRKGEKIGHDTDTHPFEAIANAFQRVREQP